MCLSQIVLTHALRQSHRWLTLDVRLHTNRAMRSIFFYPNSASKSEVSAFLDAQFTPAGASQWVYRESLYISFYDDAEREFEPEDFSLLSSCLARSDVFAVIADISGRIDGRDEALLFCDTMFSRFMGRAMDDFSMHLWTLDEIRSGYLHAGHKFFDYAGWHDERKQQDA